MGDLYPDSANAIGIVYSVNDSGDGGMIVSLEQRGEMVWSSINESTAANNMSDGLANMKRIVDNFDLRNYAAFGHVNKMNSDSSTNTNGYASGTKGVWYIPSPKELRTLYAAMCGLKLVDSGAGLGEINDWGISGGSMESFELYDAEITRFGDRFTAVGGAALNNSKGLISSAECDDKQASCYVVDFRKGGKVFDLQKDTSLELNVVRAVMAF